MTAMKEASLEDAERDSEIIDTAVPEPSLAWLPDPSAPIRSSVSGSAAPTPAAVCAQPTHASHGSRGAEGGAGFARHITAARPQLKQFRKGFLDRPRKRATPSATAAQHAVEPPSAGTMAAVSSPAASSEAAGGTVAKRPAGPVAPALDPGASRQEVFRQLQPLCTALLPLRADAQRLALAMRSLQQALLEANPVGLQARPFATTPAISPVPVFTTYMFSYKPLLYSQASVAPCCC